MTVYTCSPDLASILTCIYEAWNSRLGYRNVRLMTEPVGNLELFCDYCHVEPDTEKAASVTRSIQKKIGAAAWRLVYLCAMSERSDAPDVIYRFLLYGFSYGKDTLHMLQEPRYSTLLKFPVRSQMKRIRSGNLSVLQIFPPVFRSWSRIFPRKPMC